MSGRAVLIAMVALLYGAEARAQNITIGNVVIGYEGYGDFRVVIPSDQTSWMNGGLGKLRYGSDDQTPQFRVAEIFGEVHAQIGGEILVMAAVRAESPQQDTLFDLTEAFVRYRPVSTSPFRWSLRAGIFFAPISLENTEIGWQSPWTLTWSAINTWVGEEMRTLGAEARAEWRTDARVLSIVGSAYGWNDPTGILLADRGWALSDWVTGMQHRPRLPDVFARGRRMPIPARTFEFIEIDDRAGWYAGASWDETGLGEVEFLYYDNEADPTATRSQIAWRTDFWSAGARTHWDAFTFLAQGMWGDTFIQPNATLWMNTRFESAYGLAGWESGDWRLAARFDVFSTEETRSRPSLYMSEHGHAVTLAANWLPNDWVRVTAEWIQVDSTRRQRTLDGVDSEQIENMFQLGAKLYF